MAGRQTVPHFGEGKQQVSRNRGSRRGSRRAQQELEEVAMQVARAVVDSEGSEDSLSLEQYGTKGKSPQHYELQKQDCAKEDDASDGRPSFLRSLPTPSRSSKGGKNGMQSKQGSSGRASASCAQPAPTGSYREALQARGQEVMRHGAARPSQTSRQQALAISSTAGLDASPRGTLPVPLVHASMGMMSSPSASTGDAAHPATPQSGCIAHTLVQSPQNMTQQTTSQNPCWFPNTTDGQSLLTDLQTNPFGLEYGQLMLNLASMLPAPSMQSPMACGNASPFSACTPCTAASAGNATGPPTNPFGMPMADLTSFMDQPHPEDYLMETLMPEGHCMGNEELAAQLRAAAPCCYDD